MGGFIWTGLTQETGVHKDVARLVPTEFRGIYMANEDGSIPDVELKWYGADHTNQWGGSGGTPAIPRHNNPGDAGLIEVYDGRSTTPVASYGPVTTAQDQVFTIPGEDLTLGQFRVRIRQAADTAVEDQDDVFGREQGTGSFVVVPYHAGMPSPPLATGIYGGAGELDVALLAVLGMPCRIEVDLHAAASVASQHSANEAMIDVLTTYWKPFDTNRTRPDGLPAKPIVMNFPDFDGSPADCEVVAAVVARVGYDDVDVFMSTNEITAGDGHEGGNLSASNVDVCQAFWDAVQLGRPGALVGSPSTTRITAQAVSDINGYFAAAEATADPDAPFFDVLMLHDYPGASGTPGYNSGYYGNLDDLDWTGPVLIDEACGVAAEQEGGGYEGRQRRRVLQDMRMRAAHNLPHEVIGYFTTAQGGGFPWWMGKGPAAQLPSSYAVVGPLWVRRIALWGTSQFPESVLHHPDADEDELLLAAVYRHTTGGAQPAPSSNTGVVDLQVFGDPDASITLAISGTPGSSLVVWNADGEVLSAPVTGGQVTIDRDLLGLDGLMDGAYVFLPAGCSAMVVDTHAYDRVPGTDLGVTSSSASDGATQIRRVVDGPWKNALTLDQGNVNTSDSFWRPADLIGVDGPLRMDFTFPNAVRLREVLVAGPAPWQLQSAPIAFQLIGILNGVETVLETVSHTPEVLDWRTDPAGLSSWHMSFYNDQHVWRLNVDATVDAFALNITDATYGGSPTLTAANGFGRTTIDGSGGVDIDEWTGDNLLGAGFAGPRRPGLMRVAAWADEPSIVGGGVFYCVAKAS